jgi:hypothetical protein
LPDECSSRVEDDPALPFTGIVLDGEHLGHDTLMLYLERV